MTSFITQFLHLLPLLLTFVLAQNTTVEQPAPYQNATSKTTSSLQSQDVGAYVAAGLGLTTAEGFVQTVSAGSIESSIALSTSVSSNSSLINSTSVSSNGTVDICLSSWEAYWAAGGQGPSSIPAATYTLTRTFEKTFSSQAGYTSTTTYPYIHTVYSMDGAFAISTSLSTDSTINVLTWTQTQANASISTDDAPNTYTSTSYTWDYAMTTPACPSPTYIQSCQDDWNSYYSRPTPTNAFTDLTPACNEALPECRSSKTSWTSADLSALQHVTHPPFPACTQATMPADICWSMRDSYVMAHATNTPGYAMNPYFDDSGRELTEMTSNGTYFRGYVWPTNMALPFPMGGGGLRCTLGCARCAITAGTIDLLYWPATRTYTSGETVKVLNTTLTYPTLYVSYSQLHANNSCGPVGPTIENTILAIPQTADLSSLYGVYTATNLTTAFYGGIATQTASFNVADLDEPVPYSIYTRQPWCQSYLWDHGAFASYSIDIFESINSFIPARGNISCPTTAPYKPILYLPSDIYRSLDPLWATCSGDLFGAYDPPKALQPAASEALPTAPLAQTTTAAEQASTLNAPTPTATPSGPSQPALSVTTSSSASAPVNTVTSASSGIDSDASASDPADPSTMAATQDVVSQTSAAGTIRPPASSSSSKGIDGAGAIASLAVQIGSSAALMSAIDPASSVAIQPVSDTPSIPVTEGSGTHGSNIASETTSTGTPPASQASLDPAGADSSFQSDPGANEESAALPTTSATGLAIDPASDPALLYQAGAYTSTQADPSHPTSATAAAIGDAIASAAMQLVDTSSATGSAASLDLQASETSAQSANGLVGAGSSASLADPADPGTGSPYRSASGSTVPSASLVSPSEQAAQETATTTDYPAQSTLRSSASALDGAATGLELTLAGTTVTAERIPGSASNIELAGTTLSVGGPHVIVSGVTLSAGPSGLVMDASHTLPFAAAAAVPNASGSQANSGIPAGTTVDLGQSTFASTAARLTTLAGIEPSVSNSVAAEESLDPSVSTASADVPATANTQVSASVSSPGELGWLQIVLSSATVMLCFVIL